MLNHISIRNFAIVDQLDLDIGKGMTCVTGETGAGKSIMLDALSLTLGDKADSGMVRHGSKRAEIYASFDVEGNQPVLQWLEENDVEIEDNQLILARIITTEGRGRGYISGRPVPLNQLKDLGHKLIDIHSQHEHQSLLKKGAGLNVLDNYIGEYPLKNQVQTLFFEWHKKQKHLEQLQTQSDDIVARRQLLSYQVAELDELAINENELQELEEEHKRLANAEDILLKAQQAKSLCAPQDDQDADAATLINHALQHLMQMTDSNNPSVSNAIEMLNQSLIQVEEAAHELDRYIDGFEINPQRLQWVEQRLSDIYSTARKHNVQTTELYDLHQQLADELTELDGSDDALDELIQEVSKLKADYLAKAKQLSNARIAGAKELNQRVMEQLQSLAMEGTLFEAKISQVETPQRTGLDNIEFLVSTNPGQPLQPMAKIASGGELSRISLAIQVVAAERMQTPTMIFDEVDVGIGGGTAERVGRLLKQLGDNGQVLCVTHQPQVASQGHHHMRVAKISSDQQTLTSVQTLNPQQRVEEVARMLGGIEITESTLNHAREMIG